MMFRRAAVLVLLLVLAGCGEPPMLGQTDPLFDRQKMTADFQPIADRVAPGQLGVAVEDLGTGQIISFNGERRFPLQAVFTAPLGAAVMAEVEAKRLRLDDILLIEDVDLSPPPSGVADLWAGPMTYSVQDLLERAIRDGDNTAADVLMKRIGGPGAVTAWLQGRKVNALDIDRYQRQLQPDSLGLASFRADWKGEAAYRAALDKVPPAERRRAIRAYLADPRDTATPLGALRFLEAVNQAELLGPDSRRLLGRIISQTRGGAGRLRAAVPEGGRLNHIPATARTDLGFTPVVNDIGVYTLKDGRKFAVVAFISGSPLPVAEQEKAIADVGRVVIKAAK
ncbi:serine hydrolase [Caulobacter sp. Root1455]|uniref:serine hydrolase n=1 Tax=Caulobacter sp. Root1455 TaxID=1736465 RepID=UPI0006F414B7|nr:serine hydrolase [Caulobacter sp. Root1455]KQY92780.1 serine hydrolase [Caulobacter sp. Root1455]